MALEFIKPTYSPVKSVNGMTGEVIIEIPTHEGLATEAYVEDHILEVKGYVDAKVENGVFDVSGFATEDYVDRKIAEASMGGEVNLDNYMTKKEAEAAHEQMNEDIGRTIGTELDIKMRENGLFDLPNEERIREIAREECSGTGGGGEIDWLTVEEKLNNDYRYIYNCEMLEITDEPKFKRITDENLLNYIEKRKNYGDRFILMIVNTLAEVSVGDAETWIMNIAWTDAANTKHYWTIEERENMGSLTYYSCFDGYGADDSITEDRVNELINEALAAFGIAEEGEF